MTTKNKTPKVAAYFYENVWALTEEKLNQIEFLVDCRQQGIGLSEQEIREFVAIREDEPKARTIDGVKVIPVFGVIEKRMNMFSQFSGGTSTDMLAKDIQAAVTDPKIKAIVLDVDSPGGSVFGTAEVAEVIRNARGTKPIIAVADEMMASAAYWIASAADEIVTTNTAAVGSIGVLSVHREISAQENAKGVKTTIFKSTELKAAGNEYEPLSKAAAETMQERVDSYHALFVDAIVANRGMSPKAVNAVANGKIYIGQDAVSAGLADRIGTLNGVISELAAKSGRSAGVRAEETMSTEIKADAGATASDTVSKQDNDQAIALAKAEEKSRQREIRVLCKTFFGNDAAKMEKVVDHCVDKEFSIDKAREYVLEQLAGDPNHIPLGNPQTDRIEGGTSQTEKFFTCVSDAITIRCFGEEPELVHPVTHERTPFAFARDRDGRVLIAKRQPPKYAAGAADYRYASLLDIASESIRVATGRDPRKESWDPRRIATTALHWEKNLMPMAGDLGGGMFHTTGSFPNLLADIANKTLLAAYTEANGSWRRWVRIAEPVPDFKNINRINLGAAGTLEDIPEGQPFPEDKIGDQKESYAVQTKGKAHSFTREALINDDLDGFNRLTAAKGRAAERTINRAIYAMLISNPLMRDGNALFDDTNHGNHTDSGGAVDVAALNVMQKKFRIQTDPTRTDEDIYLDLQPRFLLIPPDMEGTVTQLLASVANPAAADGNSGVANIWKGRLEVIVVPELLSDASLGTTAWYAIGDYRNADHAEISFLRGEQSPVMEDEIDFNTKGRKFTIHQTWGIKFIDWVNIYKNDGA